MRTLSIAAVVGLLVGLAMLGRGRAINKGLGDAGYTCNRIAISGSGLVSILGTTAQYQIAPLNRGHYPQLRAVAAVDLDHEVYLARFFEPGGTGVQSFYDVCFRIQNGRVFSKTIDAAAAIEPRVERGIRQTEQEDRIQDQPAVGRDRIDDAQVGVSKPEHQAEPANLDDDRFGVEIPAGDIGRRQRSH